MINRVQSSPNFGSTSIRILPHEQKEAVSKIVKHYLSEAVGDLKIKGGFGTTPQKIADTTTGDIALIIKSQGKDTFIKVFGKNNEIDKKIGTSLTKKFNNATFTEDIK